MQHENARDSPRQGQWDFLLGELHAVRARAGNPSYAELTRGLIEQRISDGQEEYSARIAKSSVHDAFRYGRSRINHDLTRELVRLMDGDPALVDQWVEQCRNPPFEPEPIPVETAPVLPPSPGRLFLLATACVALNLVGRTFVDFFPLPIYLDMVGTAIAAIALGPWRGAAVGAATNVIGIIGSGLISLPFALVNVVGALMWGYGVRRWGLGKTLPRFFALNVLTALACSLIAVPIIVIFLGGEARVGHDAITEVVSESIDTFLVAVGFSNVITSVGDKLLSGFVALVALSALPLSLRRGFDLILVTDTPVPDLTTQH